MHSQDPAPHPNSEQTTPLLSLVLYSFLDSIIWKAYRIPHLPADRLPPLADYDRAKELRKRSFKYLDVFSGAKKQHLFVAFMKIFSKLENVRKVEPLIVRVSRMGVFPNFSHDRPPCSHTLRWAHRDQATATVSIGS